MPIADEEARWSDAAGAVTFATPYPGVARMCVTGRVTAALAEQVVLMLEAALRQHARLVVFDDWEALTGYESEARLRMTDWTRLHQEQIPETHILVRSKIVAMGVTVAAMALRKPLHVYSDRNLFERAWATAASKARRVG